MPTGKKIELGYARQLVKNYKSRMNAGDTQAVWFSKEILLTALGIDPESVEENDITGIRFYLGAYEEEPGFPADRSYSNKVTLVMVHTGTDTIEIGKNGNKEVAYKDIIDEPDVSAKTQPSYPNNPAGNDLHTFNDSQLCPPPNYPSNLGLLNW